MNSSKSKVAFIHRYGLEGWICCGGHAVPGIVEGLSSDVEIHFYGPKTTETKKTGLRDKLRIHELPYTWNRANPTDKITKTLLWYLWLPLIGLRCRFNNTKLIWNDETLPLTAFILRLFYGQNVVITVMDFFMRIYTDKKPWLHGMRDLVERIDFQSWKKIPLVFTHVHYAKQFLTDRGVPAEHIHVIPNPCNHAIFHPLEDAVRQTVRRRFGFSEQDIILSHHGILHPNKGNDWILHRLAELKDELPGLKYLLIGNGPEMSPLKNLAAQLNIADRIIFTGWLASEAELNEALASSDIGLVMRIGQETDHFHMTDTLNHEMACGKPILAVRLAGIAEFIRDGENGFLFSPEAPEEFRKKLLRMATDDNARRKFGENALRCSRKMSDPDTCARQAVGPLKALLFKP